jgi:hypothetical protein
MSQFVLMGTARDFQNPWLVLQVAAKNYLALLYGDANGKKQSKNQVEDGRESPRNELRWNTFVRLDRVDRAHPANDLLPTGWQVGGWLALTPFEVPGPDDTGLFMRN